METGQTVVLLNLQNLYESLYDALNQYYVTLGGQRYVDLGLGTHRVKCRVHKNFRLIVIEEKEVVYKQFPIPLINRLEKHYLDINTVLRNEKKDIARQLQKWVNDFVSLSGQHSMKKQYVPSDVFIGYHSDTCSSVVLQVTENQSDETNAQTILNKAKDILLNCATPDSVVRLDKSKLPDDEREHFMKQYVNEEMHSSLEDYIVYHTQQLEQSHFFFTEVTTFSRLLTAADTRQLQNVIKLDDVKLLSLQQFDTEYSFLKEIREFLGSTPADKVLIIQTDYDEDSQRRNILSSAKYSCINEINKWGTTSNTKTFVYFVTKLPRIAGGTSYVGFQGGPWRSVHIDDLRRSKEFVSDVHSLKNRSISELFEDHQDHTGVPQKNDSTVLGDLFDISELIRSCVQSAVSMLRDAADGGELITKRVESLLTLLDESQTQGVFANIVRKRLHSLLEDYEANIPNPRSWVLTEALNVNALQEGGTVPVGLSFTSLSIAVSVVTPLLANLVSVIDRDCNVDLLRYECNDIGNLWLRYLRAKRSVLMKYKNEKEMKLSFPLPHIHIAYHFYQSRLQNLSRMMSLQPNVVSLWEETSTLDMVQRWFGLQCAVCMREAQDPVGLPCHHIYCLTCIRACLDAGQAFCPHCRQQLPNGGVAMVFFIDLLSTVCFKDNTPPETHVIIHLLSYLMVETGFTPEHKQIHTKDLSPFDESPDRNPVVRSVILKLLLKFSFHEVQAYLQQHLSSIEESRFVNEGDKAELYALYINCLEVKHILNKYITVLRYYNEDGGQMDQYLVCGEEYKAVRDAVARAVVGGDVDLPLKCTAPPRKQTMFIILALFREVTTLYRSANTGLHPTPERCKAFEVLIQGSRYLHQREVRDFASALVHNRLGSLTMSPDNTIVDYNIIGLAIHLAAVLLTGTHHLVMPLKQLGLFPEHMQVNVCAFIPTMPDDMLAVAQACGLPMQRGRCLECGQEVGGDNHSAISGFTQIQLQQDCTKPGHILGDPAQRNNLDTKNMSLCPFTLVRLVTHLAMFLGASKKLSSKIIQPPVEDVCLFLTQHIINDLDQLSQALGRGTDDTITTVHLVLRSLPELVQASLSGIDPYLTTKASRNTWETTVAADIMTPQLRDLDQLLQEAKGSIRTDSRVSSNFIMRTTFGDDCTFLTSLPQGSQVHSSAVWSCRERLSLLSLTHLVEQQDQKEELPLLWRFLQKERDFRQIKLLPDILILLKHLVRKFQNATNQKMGSIGEFIDEQTAFALHLESCMCPLQLTGELKIPDEFCREDLNLNSDLQYLLPRRHGPGLCATGLVSYLVALHNELVNTVESHTGDNSSYKVTVAELTEQHVIHYELEKDLLPLVLSNCQYSLECGHETISQYDLPRIQQQILTRFLQGKPLITRTGIPTLVKTQESYETIFKAVKGKVHQVNYWNITLFNEIFLKCTSST
uniref:Ring finger protein 213 n=1 Tax=Cyclopterus lumpus TaxID=8103 RepID=A0A8C2YVV7_CYCLU